jgi:hypothetical protein
MTIDNSRNIWVVGEEGPSQAEAGRGLFEITDSTEVTLVNIGRRDGNSFYQENQWYFVREDHHGDISTIDATGLVGLFRRQ